MRFGEGPSHLDVGGVSQPNEEVKIPQDNGDGRSSSRVKWLAPL